MMWRTSTVFCVLVAGLLLSARLSCMATASPGTEAELASGAERAGEAPVERLPIRTIIDAVGGRGGPSWTLLGSPGEIRGLVEVEKLEVQPSKKSQGLSASMCYELKQGKVRLTNVHIAGDSERLSHFEREVAKISRPVYWRSGDRSLDSRRWDKLGKREPALSDKVVKRLQPPYRIYQTLDPSTLPSNFEMHLARLIENYEYKLYSIDLVIPAGRSAPYLLLPEPQVQLPATQPAKASEGGIYDLVGFPVAFDCPALALVEHLSKRKLGFVISLFRVFEIEFPEGAPLRVSSPGYLYESGRLESAALFFSSEVHNAEAIKSAVDFLAGEPGRLRGTRVLKVEGTSVHVTWGPAKSDSGAKGHGVIFSRGRPGSPGRASDFEFLPNGKPKRPADRQGRPKDDASEKSATGSPDE